MAPSLLLRKGLGSSLSLRLSWVAVAAATAGSFFRPVICWLPGRVFFFFRLHCKDGCVRSSDLKCLGHSEVLAFAAVAKRLVSFSAAGGETFPATGFLAGDGGWCCPCFSLSMEWSMFFQWLQFVVDLLRDGSCDISKALGFHGEKDGGLGWILAGWSRRGFKKTVEAPGCVCLIILYTRVFPANTQGCTVCLLNTVFHSLSAKKKWHQHSPQKNTTSGQIVNQLGSIYKMGN